jgi:hypothetical protein
MKKAILVLAILLLVILPNQETTVESQNTSMVTMADQPTIAGIFRYSKKRQQRQNSVGKINRRNKRSLRRNGLADIPTQAPENTFWMLPNFNYGKGVNNG